MIHLFQPPPPGWGRVKNMSPFCLKLEAWLRLAQVPYESKRGSIPSAPKGKIPWIVDTKNGVSMGDSGLIVSYITKAYQVSLDDHLTESEKAVSIAVQRMIEEHLYFGGVHLRWGDDHSFRYVEQFFQKVLPPVVGPFIMKVIRKKALRIAYIQGMGRHTRTELLSLMRDDLKSLSVLLGEKKFLFGDKPTSIDAVIYGFMANALWVPWDGDYKDLAREFKNLESHCERMHGLLKF